MIESHEQEPLIERTLAGLRDATPQPGIEDRILLRLTARPQATATTDSSRMRGRWVFSSKVLHPLSVSTLCLITIAGVCLLLRPAILNFMRSVHQPRAASSSSNLPLAVPTTTAQTRSPHVEVPPAPAHLPRRPVFSSIAAGPTPVSLDLAASEAAAPSHPAPPLPLSREERLIHRFVERHNTYALAALGDAGQFAHEHDARTNFQHFFEPHPPISTEPSTPAQSSSNDTPAVSLPQ